MHKRAHCWPRQRRLGGHMLAHELRGASGEEPVPINRRGLINVMCYRTASAAAAWWLERAWVLTGQPYTLVMLSPAAKGGACARDVSERPSKLGSPRQRGACRASTARACCAGHDRRHVHDRRHPHPAALPLAQVCLSARRQEISGRRPGPFKEGRSKGTGDEPPAIVSPDRVPRPGSSPARANPADQAPVRTPLNCGCSARARGVGAGAVLAWQRPATSTYSA